MLKRTMLVLLISIICTSTLPLTIFMNRDHQVMDFHVQDGIMDLSEWDSEETTTIRLDGEWEFYWNQLLTPENFVPVGGIRPIHNAMMNVPSTWNGKRIDGYDLPLPAHGAATYRMTLTNMPFDGIFALKKSNIRFSSTVFANGQKLFDDGLPASAAADYQPGNVPQIGFFSSDGGDIEIIVQVANYDYVNAGIPLSIHFGEQAAMLELHQKRAANEIIPFVILVTLAIIFVICFITAAYYRKKDYSLLTFALMSMLFALYHGLTGERPLLLHLPDIPFSIIYRWKDMCSVACVNVIFILFYQLNKGILSLRQTKLLSIVMISFLLLAAVLPIYAYVSIQVYIVVFYEFILIWLFVKISMMYIKSKPIDQLKSFLLFLVILFINLYSVDVILFALGIKDSLWLGQICILLVSLILISLVVLRLFEAYHTVDQMKNQLLRLDKIKDNFLSNTSHELKTPLNAIVSITDSLIKGVEGSLTEKQAQNLTIVLGSGRRLTHLVNELLDYSKMKHGDIELYRSSIELQPTIDSVMRIHSFLLGGKPINLVNNVSLETPAVYADGNRLIQILHNLIGNAIKFTEQGTIEVSAEAQEDHVEIRVKDTGIGITPHMQEIIFMAYEQGDAAETGQYGGTGLGLSITKKLVELHGGSIHVDSSPDHGSIFSFTLPLADKASKKESMHMENSMDLLQQDPMTHVSYPMYIQGQIDEPILVVDDEFINLQSMMNLLKLYGYSIVVVNRGQMALDELAKNRDFFLVILDITMPDMSGYEVLKQIRERFSPFELPILMLTARNRDTDVQLSIDNGANDFVAKPFEADELMARVRSLTRLKASVKIAKETEISFLRSQINPHFLFNALNSIAELCVNDPVQAEELTLQLAHYLRGSFDFKQLESLTSLEHELELVHMYMNIEKARFGDRLQVDYHIEANLTTRIPPLILQPLVENAIRHGLMSNWQGGTVTITIKEEPDSTLSFEIEDDGCGMSEHRLEEILQSNMNSKGVGLMNIRKRIMLLYGNTLRIHSKEGIGTKVSFEIPLQSMQKNGE